MCFLPLAWSEQMPKCLSVSFMASLFSAFLWVQGATVHLPKMDPKDRH